MKKLMFIFLILACISCEKQTNTIYGEWRCREKTVSEYDYTELLLIFNKDNTFERYRIHYQIAGKVKREWKQTLDKGSFYYVEDGNLYITSCHYGSAVIPQQEYILPVDLNDPLLSIIVKDSVYRYNR